MDEWDINLSPKDLEAFTEKHGWRNSQRIFSVLGRHSGFYEAVKSPIGKELLADAMKNMDYLLDKIADMTATDQEKLKYKAYEEIVLGWVKRIKIYTTHAKKLKE